MKTNILATAVALSDQDLLARLHTLARTERETTAELIAHLTALELRPSLYLADGFGSLFDYCTRALGLSEDAACSRTNVVRACRRFPVILDHLFSGALALTSVRLLSPHLTAENHEAVLDRAKNKRRDDIQALVAELAPRPDVPASVRKLPVPRAAAWPMWTDGTSALPTARPTVPSPNTPPLTVPIKAGLSDPTLGTAKVSSSVTSATSRDVSHPAATNQDDSDQERFTPGQHRFKSVPPPPAHLLKRRPIVQALAPQRYRVQFTIGHAAHDDLRTVQALLRREIPSGDPGVIFERALALLRKEVEKAKLGMVAQPRKTGNARLQGRAYENRIRFKTDKPSAEDASQERDQDWNHRRTTTQGQASEGSTEVDPARDVPRHIETALIRHEPRPSRHIPNAVKRVVWYRDRGQCAFV
jgi:hypothetical protein